MFDSFLQGYDVFQRNGAEDSFLEPLLSLDPLSRETLSKMDLSFLRQEKVDLLHLVQKRKDGMPLEYIIGRAVFMGLELYCSPDTLIPREETELLVKVALNFIEKGQKFEDDLTIIDVGTGCGNIAVSLALNSDNTNLLASDISPAALEIAQKNVNKFNLQKRVTLVCGDLFSPLQGLGYEGKIDMIVCNPPYIPSSSLCNLSPEIVDYEPTVALDAGPYGISFFRRLITDSLLILKPKGILVFEIGEGQDKLVTRLFERNGGYEDIQHFRNGAPIRVISAVKKLEN